MRKVISTLGILLVLIVTGRSQQNTYAQAGTAPATEAVQPTLTPTPTFLPCPAATMAATEAGTEVSTATATQTPSVTPSTAATQADLTVTPVVLPGYLGIRIRQVDHCGIRILDLKSDGTAMKSGLAVDDVIVAVDGVPVTTVADFQRHIASHQTGDMIPMIVQHQGQQVEIDVLLGVLVQDSSSILTPTTPTPLPSGTQEIVQ